MCSMYNIFVALVVVVEVVVEVVVVRIIAVVTIKAAFKSYMYVEWTTPLIANHAFCVRGMDHTSHCQPRLLYKVKQI